MAAVPTTVTRLSHAFTLRAGRRIIGAIHNVSFSTRRTVDTEFEVDANGYGLPVDHVPQTVETREMRISRYDTYPAVMEEVFGSSELIVLTDQYRPLSIRETWRGPSLSFIGGAGTVAGSLGALGGTLGISAVEEYANKAQADVSNAVAAAASGSVGRPLLGVLGALTPDTRIYEYTGCYFTDIGRQLDAKGDRVVSADATLVWITRRRLA